MAERKQFTGVKDVDQEVLHRLNEAKARLVSDEELREQRISFAFGNSLNSQHITKDSVRQASMSIRLMGYSK